jgi:hypothetical protein
VKRRGNVISPIDSINTIVEMLQQTDYTVEDGETVWVRSTLALYVYRVNSGLVPDGVNVIASLYGNGVWQKLNVAPIGPGSALGPFNTVAVGAAASGRLIDVTAAQLAGLSSGATVWVISVLDYWRWDPISTATSDSITICNPTANGVNPGRFVRDLDPSQEWRLQGTWFVDATLGSDENDGTAQVSTPGTLVGPIATSDEYVRRAAGKTGIIKPAVSTTINQVGNYPNVHHFVIAPDAGLPFRLSGVLPAASFTGTISAHTDLVIGTSLAAATSTWTPATELGRLVHDTTADRWAWVAKDNTGNSARVSPWSVIDFVNGGITVVTGNATNGNGIQTLVPPTCGGLAITTLGDYTIAAAGQTPILIQNLNFNGATERSVITTVGQRICFQNVQWTVNNPRINGGPPILNNCNMQVPSSTILGNDCPGFFVVNAGMWGLGDGTARAYTVNRFSTMTIQSSTLFQNCPMTFVGGARFDIRDASWGDTASPVTLTTNAFATVTASFWGTGNTGVWLTMRNATKFNYTSGATLGGAGPANDVTFGGVTTATPFNTGTRVYDAAATLSFANLTGATFNTGKCVDPLSGCAFEIDA